jgi:hypothetical protein
MNGITNNARLATVLVTCIAVTGCNIEAAPIAENENAVKRDSAGWYRGEQPLLRARADAARNRLWVLTRDGVELYEAGTREKLAHIALPGWLWLHEPYSCPPDLALGPQGEALISSNVLPTLWRIDPVTLAVSRHELALSEDNDRDVGFSGLAYSAEHGDFFAISALQGSLWRIDPALGTARKIPLSEPVRNACALAVPPRALRHSTSRIFSVCVGAGSGSQSINLAPGRQFGYVSERACAA